VNYVDRTNSKHPDGYYVIATGDDHGKVNLFKYPALDAHSQSK
jgi:hypothetical protein